MQKTVFHFIAATILAGLAALDPCISVGQEKEPSSDRILIRAKHIYSNNVAYGEKGEVYICDGKIKLVGPSIDVPGPLTVLEVD